MHEPKLFLSWGLVAWPLLTKIHKRDMKICLGVKAGTLHCLIVNLCSFLHLFLHLFLRGARGVQWAPRTRGGWGSSSPAPVQGDLQPSQAAPAARAGPHRQREELAASWEEGNVSITGGHTEPAGCCMCYTQTNSPHPELRLLSPTSPKPRAASQERAQDEHEDKPLDVKGNKTKIPFQPLLRQSVCRGPGATEDFILNKIREVQDFYVNTLWDTKSMWDTVSI